jgi:hypothetical protein
MMGVREFEPTFVGTHTSVPSFSSYCGQDIITLGLRYHRSLSCRALLQPAPAMASSFTQACQILLVGNQAAALAVIEEEEEERNARRGCKARKRVCSSVAEVYQCMGPTLFRRYYRMTYQSFWVLNNKLEELIEICTLEVQGQKKALPGEDNSERSENCVDPP